MGFEDLVSILGSGIRLSVPLICACLAGLWSERSGVVDIGLEGKILVGAFAAAAVSTYTGDPWTGDPPHENQGWYSVYDKDATTIRIIRDYAEKFLELNR